MTDFTDLKSPYLAGHSVTFSGYGVHNRDHQDSGALRVLGSGRERWTFVRRGGDPRVDARANRA